MCVLLFQICFIYIIVLQVIHYRLFVDIVWNRSKKPWT